MKMKVNEKGRLVRQYEKGDGVRRRFYDALQESRFAYPRRDAARHSPEWYCDGHMIDRPCDGIYNFAKLAESALAKAKRGGEPGFVEAARFFASTRRAMRNILAHHKVTSRMTRKGRTHARTVYSKLCAEANELFMGKGGAR